MSGHFDTDAASDLMKRILAQTQGSEESACWEELLRAMIAVRRQHPSESFSNQPVAVELVQAVLTVHYGPTGAAVCAQMSEQIAETLCDDPSTHGRMERLWDRLSGVLAEA